MVTTMHTGMCIVRRVLVVFAFLCLALLWARAADFDSYAFVNEDGTLTIERATIHLYGILIPSTETTCYTFMRPVRCGPRAVLALEFAIGPKFVECDSKARNPDGSYVAVCRTDDTDLAETLLRQGWAAALPGAPYEYKVLEEIARSRGLGIWGIPLEPIPRGPFKPPSPPK